MSTIKKKRSDFKFTKVLGEGSFSVVYLATETSTGQEYAVKELSKQHIVSQKKQKYVFREKEVLLKTNHPLIIKLHFTFQDTDCLYFGLNYAPNGEMLDYIKKYGKFDLKVSQFYTAEIVLALQYLHSINIVHRDLKPENILLNHDMHIQITDFGSARLLSNEDLAFINSSTSGYVSSSNVIKNGTDDQSTNSQTPNIKNPAIINNKASSDNVTTPTISCTSTNTNTASNGSISTEEKINENHFQTTNNINNHQSETKNTDRYSHSSDSFTDTKNNKTNNENNIHKNDKNQTSVNNNEAESNTEQYSEKLGNEKDKQALRPRKHSFVGTAQYVSPEVLDSNFSCFSSDLWAVGCIVYQFLTGSHVFTGGHDYQLFQKITSLNYKIPEPFDPSAKHLIQNLLLLDWRARLGSNETGGYDALKKHQFFHDISWDTLIEQTPPLLPLSITSPKDSSNGCELNQALSEFGEFAIQTAPKSTEELVRKQEAENIYHRFVEGNLILKQGLMDKKKGLIPRRRMFLMTEGPRLFYVDPEKMVLKGEVPWTKELHAEAKSYHTIHLHTPNRIYYLEEPNGNALAWCKALNQLTSKYYP